MDNLKKKASYFISCFFFKLFFSFSYVNSPAEISTQAEISLCDQPLIQPRLTSYDAIFRLISCPANLNWVCRHCQRPNFCKNANLLSFNLPTKALLEDILIKYILTGKRDRESELSLTGQLSSSLDHFVYLFFFCVGHTVFRSDIIVFAYFTVGCIYCMIE